MADVIGTLAIPTTAPAAGVLAGFPELRVIADYCKAALNADALEHWRAVSPGTPPVKTVFTHDPRRLLDDSRLPSLYCFGRRSRGRWQGADIRIQETEIQIYWIMEPAQEAHCAAREQCQSMVSRILDRALTAGRHTSWIAPGDTDPDAASWGSSLAKYTGALFPLVVGEWSPLDIRIEIIDGKGRTQSLYGVAGSVSFEMQTVRDPAVRYVTPTELDATIKQMPLENDGTSAYAVAFGDATPVTP